MRAVKPNINEVSFTFPLTRDFGLGINENINEWLAFPRMPGVEMNRLLVVCGLSVVFAAGCTENYGGRQEISGTVTLKGQPIQDGALIVFAPLDGQDTGANAGIANGAFTIPRENGLKPGKYLVRVTAGDGVTAVNPLDEEAQDAEAEPGPGGGRGNTNIISKELVPKDWNVNSKQQVTVTADGPNAFDFDIP